MSTVNHRVHTPQAVTINGVDAGGLMQATISAGYENIIRSGPDGFQVPIIDREIQFVRGTIVSQDWIHLLDLLTGTVSTYVFYERKSGVAETTGYIKHTLTNPVVHNVRISQSKGGYMTVAADFECRADDPTKTIRIMWTQADEQAAPTYVSAARGGWRVKSAVHNPGVDQDDIYHVMSFDFGITLPLLRACNDADVAYTAVDTVLTGMSAAGNITIQDSEIATSILKVQELVTASRANLVLTVTQSGGAADKVLTIAGVIFHSAARAEGQYTQYSLPFEVSNDADTPLTLDDVNKILTLADV